MLFRSAIAETPSMEVLLSTTTVTTTVSSIDLTFDESLYASVRFEMSHLALTSDGVLELRTSSDDGSSYDGGSSDYSYAQLSTVANVTDNTADHMRLTASHGASTNEDASGVYTLVDPSDGTKFTHVYGNSVMRSSSSLPVIGSMGGMRKENAVVNGVRFLPSSGSISGGTIRMIGVLK